MPTPTYVPLASITLSASSLSVSFSSIAQTYRDLMIVCTTGVVARTGSVINFNSDTTAANYSGVWMLGNGTSATSSTSTTSFLDVVENSTTNLTTSILQIMDYSATNKHKTVLVRNDNATPNGVEAYAIRWANTAAITTIDLNYSGEWASGSTFVLYGIAG